MSEDSVASDAPWALRPGDSIVRKQLHREFGGRTQGGIGPSARTPNVFLFTDPAVGHRHGYYDGWSDDGAFHYTGEGQRGDQQLVQGNLAILRHVEQGRSLRLFLGVGGEVNYVGEFRVASDDPYYRTDAPETGDGPVREVIVFRLLPIGESFRNPGDNVGLGSEPAISSVPIEAHNTERFIVTPNAEPIEAERREQALVVEYTRHMESRGSVIGRHRYRPPGESKPLFNDVFDETRANLIEAKGTCTREAVRMALGQLADYQRFEATPIHTAILLPHRPRPDLEQLAASQGVAIVWRADAGFSDTAGGQFS